MPRTRKCGLQGNPPVSVASIPHKLLLNKSDFDLEFVCLSCFVIKIAENMSGSIRAKIPKLRKKNPPKNKIRRTRR